MNATLPDARTSTQAHSLAELLPPLTDQEYAELREDIRDNGLLDKIIRYEGLILDGRHRERICLELGIEPAYEDYDGDWAGALARVRKTTKGRKFTTSQLAMLAVKFTEAEASGGPEGPRGPSSTEKTRKQVAKDLGVGERTVKRAAAVERKSPILAGAVMDGTIQVGTAQTLVGLSPEEQAVALKMIKEGQKASQVVTEIKPQSTKTFDDSKIAKHLAQLVRLVENRAEARGKSIEYRDMADGVNEVMKRWSRWQIKSN